MPKYAFEKYCSTMRRKKVKSTSYIANYLINSEKFLLVPYTKDFGRITRF